MFVDYAADTEMPAPRLGGILAANIAAMEGFGAAAYRRGEGLHSKVGPGGPIAKEVVVALGTPQMRRSGLVVPVTWRATGAQMLFPRLEGDLAVEVRGPNESALRLRASYRPPLGAVGGLVDRLLLAGVARSTVADWVDRIVEWATEEHARRVPSTVSPEGQDNLDQRPHPEH